MSDLTLAIRIRADGSAEVVGATRQIGQALDELGHKGSNADRSLDRLAGDLDRLFTSLDPARARTKNLADAFNLLDRGVKTGLVSQTQYADAMNKLAGTMAGTVQAAGHNSMAMRTVTSNLINTGQVAIASRGNLTAMIGPLIDVGQGLAMMGTRALAGFGLVAAGVALVVAPLATALFHAVRLESQTRELTVSLKALGRQGTMSAADIRALGDAMAGQGPFGRGETLPAAKMLIGYQQFGRQAIGEIAKIAVDFSAATGQELVQGTQQLATALGQGYEGIRKLDEAYQFLTADELMRIRALTEHGQRAEALRLAIGALHRQFDGLAKEGMGAATRSLHELGQAWDRLLDSVARTALIRESLGGLAWVGNTIASWLGNSEARIAKLNQELDNLEARRRVVVTDFARGRLDEQIAAIKADLDRLRPVIQGGTAANDNRVDPADLKTAREIVADTQAEAAALRLSNAEREKRLALIQAEIASRGKGPEAAAAERGRALGLLDARRDSQIIDAQDRSIAGTLAQWDLARAFQKGDAQALRMKAMNQAIEEQRLNPRLDAGQRRDVLLGEGAAGAGADLASRIAAFREQVAAIERVTEAQKKGSEAAQEAERANKTLADTAQFRNALEAAGIKDVEGLMTAYDQLTRREGEAGRSARALAKAREASPTLAYQQEIADLDALKAKMLELGATHEEVTRLYEEAERRKLAASREWKDGVLSAIKDYGEEAGNQARQFGQVTTAALKASEDAWVKWAKTGKLSVTGFFDTLADAALRAAYKLMIYKPMEGLLQGLLDGFSFNFGSNGAGGMIGDFPTPASSSVVTVHSGGVIGVTPLIERQVDPALFDRAPRYHRGGIVGLAPDERPAILKEGEEILTESDPRHRYNRALPWRPESLPAANVNIGVQVIDQRTADQPPVEIGQERGPDGQTLIRLVIPALRRDLAKRGEFSQALEQSYDMPRRRA